MQGGEETFLLVTAALANLTFMSSLTSTAMRKCGTVKTLVKAVKLSPFTTLFAKDQVRFLPQNLQKISLFLRTNCLFQVVTVLANMAGNANCRPEIRAVEGIGFLLAMLETKVTSSNLSQAELAAAERVQKKAAIALSR